MSADQNNFIIQKFGSDIKKKKDILSALRELELPINGLAYCLVFDMTIGGKSTLKVSGINAIKSNFDGI